MVKPNRSTVTSYDVARLAGVSQSAVSRCYTPGGNASAAMRHRVAEAAERLGWQPRALAPVATGRSSLIAVIVSELTSAAYPELLFALSRAFNDRDMSVVLVSVVEDGPMLDFLEPLAAHRVDGVVVATNLGTPAIDAIRQRGLPLLLYNRVMPKLRLPAVSCDHAACGRLLAEHVLALGHRRIAVIGAANSVVGDGRVAGIVAALADAGLTPVARTDGDFSYASGVGACAALWPAAPTAILCANDAMAAGAVDWLRLRAQVEVPDAVSVGGIDGADVGSWLAYRLTTVRQPAALLGAAAAGLMLARIGADARYHETRLFGGELEPGGSTAPPPT